MTEIKLAKKIEIMLSTLLGSIMAAATVKVQCERIAVKADELSRLDLPQLATAIERALIIFVGTTKAKEVANSIKNIA
ncbi:MAG: hypothetical protein HY920_03285 [Elusimicrobia bacterium]|nr:hypothetical protein [Elusimicrobiota bacterium]